MPDSGMRTPPRSPVEDLAADDVREQRPSGPGQSRTGSVSDLVKWLIAFALTAAATVICYLWLDRPIAYFVHDHFARSAALTRIFLPYSMLLGSLTPLIILALGMRALANRPLSYGHTVLLLCCVCLLVSDGIKPYLKHAFGRTWPDTLVSDYSSLIYNGEYGFFPFRRYYYAYGSFPSGYMSAICAVLGVLWLCYPKYRLVYGLIAFATAAALIVPNYHFLSDVIAGAFLGVSIGWIAVALWRNGTALRS